MPDIQARIEAVLRDALFYRDPGGELVFKWADQRVMSREGGKVDYGDPYIDNAPAALASVLVESLGLTQEWRVMEDGEQIAWPPSHVAARNIVAIGELGGDTPVIESRLVTEWVKE